jgi:hypothetical protein
MILSRRAHFIANLAACCLAALTLCGCSTFSRDFKAAASTPPPANDITGRWEGRWVNEVNGHNGRLRCLVSKLQDGGYSARFHAKYMKVLSFSYAVPLTVKRSGENFTFQGEADLGKTAGGVYHYEGHASATNFFSTYRCSRDHGTFQMARPKEAK